MPQKSGALMTIAMTTPDDNSPDTVKFPDNSMLRGTRSMLIMRQTQECCTTTTTTTIILRPLYRTTCVSRHPVKNWRILLEQSFTAFHASRRRCKMCSGHGRLCVCLSVPRHIPTLLHGPGCNLGEWQAVPTVVHYWVDLQSVHGFRCYDNTARTRNVSECLYSLHAWLSCNQLHSVNVCKQMNTSLSDVIDNCVHPHSEKRDFLQRYSPQCLQCFDAVGWAAGRASGL